MAQRLNTLASLFGGENRLASIRTKNKLDADELKQILFGEGNYAKYVQPLLDFIQDNQHIFTHHNIEDQSRKQARQEAARIVLTLIKHCQLDLTNQPLKLVYTLWTATLFDGGIVTKGFLHYFLYAKSLILFQSHPKHQEFIENARSLKDLGCFGLTEFHHGSYSKEIQTLAIYDHTNKEFVMSTQGQKGMKYWIGAAAEIANMSIIWAQLIINGQSQGPHPFVVPLRCKKTHRVLPGVIIGDCGPKNGLNYIDNGYIILEDVRIPSSHLLGKLGSIDENGTYVTMIENKDMRFGFHMSPLSGGRGAISFIANAQALKAVTCALRYACSRRQFQTKKGAGQNLIIDYPITKARLIPFVAQIFVQIAPGLQIANAYFGNPQIFNNLKYVSELHAVSAAVKARISWNCTAMCQESRTILGGYGYSSFSHLSNLFHDTDINNTWEGDNNMLLQQTSKYLMKTISKKASTQIIDLSFIWKASPVDQDKVEKNMRSLDTVESLLKDLIIVKYSNAKTTFDQLSKKYSNKSEVWLHFHPQTGNSLSLSFADYFFFIVTKESTQKTKNQKNRAFLTNCIFLWAYRLLQSENYGSKNFKKILQRETVSLCQQLSEVSVVATDIILPSEEIVGSVFANYEGEGLQGLLKNVYSSKNTFSRPSYYSQILQARKKL